MKCPSCGIWNRAHFTKCFRCGTELPEGNQPGEIEQPAFDEADEWSAPDVQQPAAPAAPFVEEEIEALAQPQVPFVESSDEGFDPQDEIFSLYDDGDWDDDAEDDTDTVYGAPVVQTQDIAPIIHPVEIIQEDGAASEYEDDDDDEPLTAYIPPSRPDDEDMQDTHKFTPALDAGAQETRRFAPLSPEGDTQKFDLAGGKAVQAMPEIHINDPEVAEAEPGIGHEIIHAIFTNPPASLSPDPKRDIMDEARPRKLMSRRRAPQPPVLEQDDEPATVYKPRKAEPRVDNVEEFKPTARIAAQIADEQGTKFTAFATAKRSLVAEVESTDPFEEAIELPLHAKSQTDELEMPETAEELDYGTQQGETPLQAEHTESSQAAIAPPQQEHPEWVKEALSNLGQNNRGGSNRQTPQERQAPQQDPRQRRAPAQQSQDTYEPPRRAARNEQYDYDEQEPATRYERSPRQSAPPPNYNSNAPRSGLDAIARHEAARSTSLIQRNSNLQDQPLSHRNAQHPNQGRPQEHAPRQPQPEYRDEPLTRSPRRAPDDYARQQQAPRGASANQDHMRANADQRVRRDNRDERTSGNDSSGQLHVANLPRLIIVGVVALALIGLLIWGAVAGVKAIIAGVSNPEPNPSQQAGADPSPVAADPNAPTIAASDVNGRPGHTITFKGNDGDIIYISIKDLGTNYNIAIADGQGVLQIEDSALIGDRFASEDVEVTLTPVLHDGKTGKETTLSPISFTVTPPDAYLEIVNPVGGTAETTLGTYQVKIRVDVDSEVTIDGNDVSDLITEEDNGIGSIMYNVVVEPTGENTIPVAVQKKGCKSISKNILLTRPLMAVPIELDAATPSTSQSATVNVSGKVGEGVTVKVTSTIDGEVTTKSDGTFSFVAKLANFGDNDVVIVATKGEETSTLTHTITYTPTANEYTSKALKMDYSALTNYAGKYRPFKCTGVVVEVMATQPYTCTFNIGTDDDPKYLYLEMVEGKPLEEGIKYDVYADVHADGSKDGYPYMIGRFFYVK